MMERTRLDLAVEGHLPSLEGATEWINSPPLTPSGLGGKVALFDFCTYTCINWIRTLPYIRAWADRYGDHGLVMVGVHTPEFSFEKDLENVREALTQMRVTYPVAVDSDHAVWDAFANQYWPALYFVDAEGRIRHHRFGEGDYDRSEIVIRQLLAEAGVEGIGGELVAVDPQGPEVAADWGSLGSGESYLGYRRTDAFASPGGLTPNEARVYDIPGRLRPNHWALSGDWTATPEAVVLNEPNGRIARRFEARDVHLVMGPPSRGSSVRFRVFIDGQPPGAAAGSDVDRDGSGQLDLPRMYQLIRQHGPVTDRFFEIEFLDPGAQGFAFTFG
jgi:Thioredoxin like C-terminal domain/AhpC/TSA family